MYRLLGYINVALLVIITSPWWLRYLNKWFFPDRKLMTTKFVKGLRVAHKILGVCLLILIVVHGFLALGVLRLHTGLIAGVMVLIVVTLGALHYRLKKPALFKWHKRAVLILVILVALHLIFPNALYYLY